MLHQEYQMRSYIQQMGLSTNPKDNHDDSIQGRPRDHFTNHLWVHNTNLVKIYEALVWLIMIQSVDNFAHVTTAELSWYVQNCDLIGSLESKLEHKGYWQDVDYELRSLCEMVPAHGTRTFFIALPGSTINSLTPELRLYMVKSFPTFQNVSWEFHEINIWKYSNTRS